MKQQIYNTALYLRETLIKNQRSTLNCYYLHFFRFNGINGPSIPSLHA